MGEIVSKAKFFIDYSGGNFQLKKLDTVDVSFEAELEVVKALGVPGGAGYRESQGGGELALEVFSETGNPEVNYFRLFQTKELFRFVIQEEDGQRFQYRSCRVAKPPGRKYDTGGNVKQTVTLKFLQHGEL